ncbi:hypothetical protein I3842_15G068200 [Carya illinoinensis]|uniref:Reverse transcriptase zinc-binding domain-containing protein n=1 Tax=Carya illinoinensis TaxID=32201 RepID=A0A922ADW0_CARIL|nr:hypothetical protein I3842_15G068200 [Carya illinoinensis]
MKAEIPAGTGQYVGRYRPKYRSGLQNVQPSNTSKAKLEDVTRPHLPCLLVSDLIDSRQRSWKKESLVEIFSEQKIEAISSIPINLRGREDKLFWQFTSNGLYTIKSGYHHQRQIEAKVEGEQSSRQLDSIVWKKIWQLKVTPAVKHFIWKACSEAIPTFANLKKRRTVEDNICMICKSEPETTNHVLWGCAAARDVWNQGYIKIQKMNYHNEQLFRIWVMLAQKLEKNELEEAAVTMRGIWTRRNELVHGKEFKHPTILSKGAKLEVLAFTEANLSKEIPQQRAERRVKVWSKPIIGTFKVNWDAAVKVDTGRIGLGVLVRDHQAYEAEAHGLLLAAIFCKELVINQLLGQETDWSMGGWLIEDTKQVLASMDEWKAGHVQREANYAAHNLAKYAILLTEDLYNIEECPTCIYSIVSSEMLSI